MVLMVYFFLDKKTISWDQPRGAYANAFPTLSGFVCRTLVQVWPLGVQGA